MKLSAFSPAFLTFVFAFGLATSELLHAESETQTKKGEVQVFIGSQHRLDAQAKASEIVALGATITLEGQAESVILIGGKLHLIKGATISDRLVNVGGQVTVDPGAYVSGSYIDITTTKILESVTDAWMLRTGFWESFWTILIEFAFGAFGFLYVSFFTQTQNNVVGVIKTKLFLSGLLGALLSFSMGAILLLLVVSVAGILIVPFVCLGFLFILFVGKFALAGWVGSWIVSDTKTIQCFFVGWILVILLGYIPFLGLVVQPLGLFIGSGASLYYFWNLRQSVGAVADDGSIK
ncbi:MAG: hypothetical protein IT289_08180 [Oligoflexia bacterium]|nr:hypothetical protein [Oligoflexia bacterium]